MLSFQCPNIPPFDESFSRKELWQVQMDQFTQCAHATVKFSKLIPGQC